mgnify:CR=1 FL=1
MISILKYFYLIIFVALPFSTVRANNLTMTTYYPSPTGHYDTLSADNIGIGTLTPMANLDVNGNALVRGDASIKGLVTASAFKTSDKLSVMTLILFDQSGVKRSCPSGYKLMGQWVTLNGGSQFITIDSLGNTIPEGASGVMGLCSAI